ncbi:MAG: DMT family transporter [Desulfobacterales bacterium]
MGQRSVLKADVLLLITALIWGFAFVAQRAGMDHLGPYYFNAIRFTLGALSLVPLWIVTGRRPAAPTRTGTSGRTYLIVGGLAGAILFLGASLQQVGLVYTTAGNAGFITGLYVVLVPILGLWVGMKTDAGTWIGAVLAALGLYLLCVSAQFSIAFGDLLNLIGAFFWASHVLVIARYAPRMQAVRLAFIQYTFCALLSFTAGGILETVTWQGVEGALIPLLFGGVASVGIAYTLQVQAQKNAPPSHAAILLSMEAVFAVLGGWWLLDEQLSLRSALGCGLMLTGMLLSQTGLGGLFVRPKGPVPGNLPEDVSRIGP